MFSDMLVKLREQTIGKTRGKNKDMVGDQQFLNLETN